MFFRGLAFEMSRIPISIKMIYLHCFLLFQEQVNFVISFSNVSSDPLTTVMQLPWWSIFFCSCSPLHDGHWLWKAWVWCLSLKLMPSLTLLVSVPEPSFWYLQGWDPEWWVLQSLGLWWVLAELERMLTFWFKLMFSYWRTSSKSSM